MGTPFDWQPSVPPKKKKSVCQKQKQKQNQNQINRNLPTANVGVLRIHTHKFMQSSTRRQKGIRIHHLTGQGPSPLPLPTTCPSKACFVDTCNSVHENTTTTTAGPTTIPSASTLRSRMTSVFGAERRVIKEWVEVRLTGRVYRFLLARTLCPMRWQWQLAT